MRRRDFLRALRGMPAVFLVARYGPPRDPQVVGTFYVLKPPNNLQRIAIAQPAAWNFGLYGLPLDRFKAHA